MDETKIMHGAARGGFRVGRWLLGTAALSLAVPQPGLALPAATERQASMLLLTKEACPHAGAEAVGLIAVVASFAADFLVGWIGKSLEARRAGLTGSFVASGTTLGSDVGGDIADVKCVIVFRGKLTSSIANPVTAAALQTANPDFYLEASLKSAPLAGDPSKKALQLTPIYLDYGATVAKTKGNGFKNVSVAIAISPSTPPTGALPSEANTLAVFRHNLGRLKVGQSYSGTLLQGTGSAQLAPPGTGINVTALVTESEEAGPALEALIGAFTKNQDAIGTLIKETVTSALEKKKE